MKAKTWLFTIGVAASCYSYSASAVLGGDEASVQADRLQMNGTIRTTQSGGFTLHEIQAASGAAVKEYVSPAGVVFALSWTGPSLPDLRQLLGPYFDTYVEAANAQRTGLGPINVQQPGLVVQSGGKMRAFFGRAYVPAMIPPGVTAGEIQ